MDGYRGAVERGRGRGLSRIRAEIDRYNHEISNIRREGEGEGKYEEEEESAWDSAESGVGSPKSLVLVEEGGSKCKIRCQSSAIRISATTVFTANRGDLIYTNPNFPESARETTTKAWQSQSHEGGGEPLEALPEPLYADKFNSTQINLQTAGGEPLEALSEPLYADKFNSTEINLQTAGGVPLEALSEPLYADKSNSAQIDLRTAAPSSFPNELPCTESRAPHIYSFKDSAVAMSMASKIKSILERVDVRVHGSQVQTDAGNYSCTSHPAQLRSLSKTNNAVLQMVTDPESFHNTLENMHTSEQYLIPFTDHQWFETQLKEIKEEPRSNEIPDPKLYLERIVAALSRKDQIGYLDQYKCSTTKGTASSLKSSCTSVVHERSNVCNHQETKYYKSSATIYDPKKDTHLPTLSTGTGHHKNILQVFKEDEDSDSKPVHMLDCQDSATLPTYSDKNIQVNRAEDKENDKTEESGCQTLPSYPQALCCSTYEQINTNPMSDLSCDVKQTYRDGCHCNDQFPKESQQKVVNLLEGCQLLEKNFVGAKPHQHLQQVPRLLPERKQNESLDDETQVANRAVAAAGLANELEVLMATGKDPRILKKPVQQEEEIHHSKLDLPVETAAKAACQSARDLIKEPMWKGPQTKPVQKNPQIKLRQRSVTQEEKPLAAKKIAGNLIGEMFDYDLMYQELRNIENERKKIEQRVKARPLKLADHSTGLSPMKCNQRGSKDEASFQSLHRTASEAKAQSLGAKRRRPTYSPARGAQNKLLRSSLGRREAFLDSQSHQSFVLSPLVTNEELLLGSIYNKRYMRCDNAKKINLLRKNKHCNAQQLQANNKVQITEGTNANQRQGIEGRKNYKPPTWVDRMAKGRPCHDMSEFKHKNTCGNYSLQIPLKRRSVRPPGSIFKSSTIVQWKAESNLIRQHQSRRTIRHLITKSSCSISLDKQRRKLEKNNYANPRLKPINDDACQKHCFFLNKKPPEKHGLKLIKLENDRSAGCVIPERLPDDRSVNNHKLSSIKHCKDASLKLVDNSAGSSKLPDELRTGSEESDPGRVSKAMNETDKVECTKDTNFEIKVAGNASESQLMLEPEVMESIAMEVLESELKICTHQAEEHGDSSLRPESWDSSLQLQTHETLNELDSVVDCKSHENEELRRTLLEIAIQSILKDKPLKNVQAHPSPCGRETEGFQFKRSEGETSGHQQRCEGDKRSTFVQTNMPLFFPTCCVSNTFLPLQHEHASPASQIAKRPRKIRRCVVDRWNKKRLRRQQDYSPSPTTPSTPLTSPGHAGKIKKALTPFSEPEPSQVVSTSTDGDALVNAVEDVSTTMPRLPTAPPVLTRADGSGGLLESEGIRPLHPPPPPIPHSNTMEFGSIIHMRREKSEQKWLHKKSVVVSRRWSSSDESQTLHSDSTSLTSTSSISTSTSTSLGEVSPKAKARPPSSSEQRRNTPHLLPYTPARVQPSQRQNVSEGEVEEEAGQISDTSAKDLSVGVRRNMSSAIKLLHQIFSSPQHSRSRSGQSYSEGELSPGCLSK